MCGREFETRRCLKMAADPFMGKFAIETIYLRHRKRDATA